MNIEKFYYDEQEKMIEEMKREMEEHDQSYLQKNGKKNAKSHCRKHGQSWKMQSKRKENITRLSMLQNIRDLFIYRNRLCSFQKSPDAI